MRGARGTQLVTGNLFCNHAMSFKKNGYGSSVLYQRGTRIQTAKQFHSLTTGLRALRRKQASQKASLLLMRVETHKLKLTKTCGIQR